MYLQAKANLHNEKLCLELENVLETELLKQINNLDSDFNDENLKASFRIPEGTVITQAS